jgi:hypothetical protein
LPPEPPALRAGEEEWVVADEKRASVRSGKEGKGGLKFVLGPTLQYVELHPLRVRRFLHVSHHALSGEIIRVGEQGNQLGLENHLGKQLEPLGHQLGGDPRDVPAWPGETGDQASFDRVGGSSTPFRGPKPP